MGICYGQLSPEERVEIDRLKRQGLSLRHIGAALGRAPSTISRELARNSQRDGWYNPVQAQHLHKRRRARHDRFKLARKPALPTRNRILL